MLYNHILCLLIKLVLYSLLQKFRLLIMLFHPFVHLISELGCLFLLSQFIFASLPVSNSFLFISHLVFQGFSFLIKANLLIFRLVVIFYPFNSVLLNFKLLVFLDLNLGFELLLGLGGIKTELNTINFGLDNVL